MIPRHDLLERNNISRELSGKKSNALLIFKEEKRIENDRGTLTISPFKQWPKVPNGKISP